MGATTDSEPSGNRQDALGASESLESRITVVRGAPLQTTTAQTGDSAVLSKPLGTGNLVLNGFAGINQRVVIAVLLLAFVFNAWLLNLIVHIDWIPVLPKLAQWVLHPVFAPVQLPNGILPALLAITEILVMGTLASSVMLPNESDLGIRRLTAAILGLGLTGWIVILVSIVGGLFWLSLNLSVLLAASALVLIRLIRDQFIPTRFLSNLRDVFAIWVPRKLHISPGQFFVFGIIVILSLVEYWHSFTAPVLHWDALVYHATMAKIMFREHGIPIIAGPSVGIEMSANYPPLFPALGAFFYTQIGQVDDLYLRLLSPTAGLLTAFVLYKTGLVLGSRWFANIAALSLALSPLFIVTSIFPINYLIATLFLASTLMFLLFALSNDRLEYWAAAGMMWALAFSTTYQAFFFAPAVAIAFAVAYFRVKPGQRLKVVKNILVALATAFVFGSLWYVRNLATVGNPIFPFAYGIFGGSQIDPTLLNRSIEGIHADSLFAFFGTFLVSPLDLPRFLILNKSHFPVISAITLLGLALVPLRANRAAWLVVLSFGLIPFVIVSSTVANIFPRYFIFSFPGLALLSALPLAQAAEWIGEQRARNSEVISKGHSPSSGPSAILAPVYGLFIALALLFPSSLALIAGPSYQEAEWPLAEEPPRVVGSPNGDVWPAVAAFYGPEGKLWQWLNNKVAAGESIATFENRIYYIKDGDTRSLFYLDGWEARELYKVADPAALVQMLSQNGVRYVLDPSWVRHWGMYNQLPLVHLLGMPAYFPLVYGDPMEGAIYQVGPIHNAITAKSALALALTPAETLNSSSPPGTFWKIVEGSDNPRVYVENPATARAIEVEIDYLDLGGGSLSVNVLDRDGWKLGYATGQLANTGQTKTIRFSISADNDRAYVELGLHAFSNDVLISAVRAAAAK